MDSSQLPASIIQAAMFDPAAGTSAPPNFGQEIVPHIHTASGRYGIASHAYLNMDEALRDSRQNAERMRADCEIMEGVEQRQRAVALHQDISPGTASCEFFSVSSRLCERQRSTAGLPTRPPPS